MSETTLTVPKSAAPEVSDDQMDQIVSEMGVVKLPPSMVQNLATLGVGLQERGLVKFANGAVVVTTSAMLDTVQRIHKKLQSPKRTVDETRALAYALGYLSRNITQNLNAAVKQESVVAEVSQEQDRRRRKSFVPHAVVHASGPVQVNVHNHPSEPEKAVAKELKPA